MSTFADVTIPHNRKAEEAVIGSVLIDPDIYNVLAQFVHAQDFYIVRHRWIWDAFVKLHEKNMPIDFLTLSETLDKAGKLEEVGGPAYLTALLNETPTSLHAEAYGRMISEEAIRRRLIGSANQIATLAYDKASEIEEVISKSVESVNSVVEGKLQGEYQDGTAIASAFYDLIEERSKSDVLPGIPSGFIDVDMMLGGGFQNTDFVLIAGRPGSGKTTFLDQIVMSLAKRKKFVYLWTGEMSTEQQFSRMISSESRINNQAIRTGRMQEHEWPKFIHAVETLGVKNLFIDGVVPMTLPLLRAKLKTLKAQGKLDLVALDYAGLLSAPGQTEYQQNSYISRNLKLLAKELDVPVLAAHQMSRAVEGRAEKKPVMSDLRGSGTWEQDADDILMIWHNPDDISENTRSLEFTKQRNGPTGTVDLVFEASITTFHNAAKADHIDFYK